MMKNIFLALSLSLISSTAQTADALSAIPCGKKAEVIIKLKQAPKNDLTIALTRVGFNNPGGYSYVTTNAFEFNSVDTKGFLTIRPVIKLVVTQPLTLKSLRIMAPKKAKVTVRYKGKKIGTLERNAEAETVTIPGTTPTTRETTQTTLYAPLRQSHDIPETTLAALVGAVHGDQEDHELHFARLSEDTQSMRASGDSSC